MSIFKKNLPVSICPLRDNPQGNKIQALLRAVDKDYILLETVPEIGTVAEFEALIEFSLDKNRFHFNTIVYKIKERPGLLLKKPKEIHRSRIREGPRVPLEIPIHYTPWTEEKRFSVETRDMSESGVRIQGLFELAQDSIISLDFYLKEPKIRVICQGLVSWSKPDPENNIFFQSGIQFTTISNEAKKKLARYLADLNEEQPQ